MGLENVSKKKNIDILVGHHRRHNPIIKKAFDLINNNEIGKLRTVHISCQMYKPSRYFKNKSWSKNEGAGPIIVNLIHDLDLMNYLLGDIKSVFCNITSNTQHVSYSPSPPPPTRTTIATHTQKVN